jgi:hypothetical protein
MESIGFKEWAMVCDALGRGEQNIILRKGGLAEGRQGFSFKHREFFLFPTWFHEQLAKVRGTEAEPPPSGDAITIKYFAKLEQAQVISSRETAAALAPLHILQPEVVHERFDYDEAPGLHVGFVRVFRVVPGWTFPNEKKYAGCRSWVQLPAVPANLILEAVLNDNDHRRRTEEFLNIVGDEPALQDGRRSSATPGSRELAPPD